MSKLSCYNISYVNKRKAVHSLASWYFNVVFIPLFFYTHILSTESGGKPTLSQLLNFPGKSGKINIPEKIGTHYKTFGIFLLKDDNGAKVESIAKEEGESIHISLKILSKWLQGEGMQPPTWSTIIEALKMSNLGVLAKDVRAVIES